MLYKKIISNGGISKAMHGGETIWQQEKKPGISPVLQKAIDYAYIRINGQTYRKGPIIIYYSDGGTIEADTSYAKDQVDLSFRTLDRWVIYESGKLSGRGTCKVLINAWLKNPDEGYEKNYAGKYFEVTVK